MTLTEKQREEFDSVVRPVIRWLNETCHPHTRVLIDCTCAELCEGINSTGQIFDYVKD